MGNCLSSTEDSKSPSVESVSVASINKIEEECTNDISCPKLSRLKAVMHYYEEWTLNKSNQNDIIDVEMKDMEMKDVNVKNMEEAESKSEVLSQSEEPATTTMFEYVNNLMIQTETNIKYSVIHLIQDYHHLIKHHDNQFEEIYDDFINTQVITCDINNCGKIRRNHRDRSQNQRNQYNVSNERDWSEYAVQQICDLIHCYIFHTFDMGFKLRKIELKSIDEYKEEEQKEINDDEIITLNDSYRSRYVRFKGIGRIIEQKKTQIREIRDGRGDKNGRSLDDNNKFMSIVNEENYENDKMFSFGIRYFYDVKYKENDKIDYIYNIGYDKVYRYKDWFIGKKYKDIKDELLQNKICCIEKVQYNDLYTKCKYYMDTEYVLSEFKNMKKVYLLAMMIYCNFDKLQYEFSKTYRRKDIKQSDQDLKDNHSEFRNLGYSLLKIVELTGTKIESGRTKTFYHGINTELMFTSTLSRFCGPISTSSEYEVALIFTKQSGIILELIDGTLLSKQSNSMYFDCEYLSDFAYEKEKFFIGGKSPLKINSIYHVELKQNYGVYIELINLLLSIMKNDITINFNKGQDKAIIKLLNHELKNKILPIPNYVSRLLHHICLNTKEFSTRYKETFGSTKNTKYQLLAQFFCYNDCQLFNLDLLKKLFPNLRSISIDCGIVTHKVIEYILSFLKDCKLNNIKNDMDIIFSSPIKPSIPFKIIQEKYAKSFAEYGCLLEINEDYLLIKRKKSRHVKTDSGLQREVTMKLLRAQSTQAHIDGQVASDGIDVFVNSDQDIYV